MRKKANLKALKDNNNEFMKAKKITSQNNWIWEIEIVIVFSLTESVSPENFTQRF